MAWNGDSSRVRVPRTGSTGPQSVNGRAHHMGAGQRQLLPPHGLPAPDVVPGFSRARLPANYQAARKAISECARIDECKSWSDKASALASYARQAKDRHLLLMAERIHARAMRRCGELLKHIPSGQGSKNQYGELRDGAVTRHAAGSQAGLSERQRVTALRLASVPRENFDDLVETDPPPTVTELAELGRETRAEKSVVRSHPYVSGHPDTVRAARARKMFWNIREFCQENKATELAGAFAGQDGELLRQFVADLRRWLEEFEGSL